MCSPLHYLQLMHELLSKILTLNTKPLVFACICLSHSVWDNVTGNLSFVLVFFDEEVLLQ